MWGVSMNTQVISFAPTIMVSLALALSVDYTLFLLSRFREEITILKKNKDR